MREVRTGGQSTSRRSKELGRDEHPERQVGVYSMNPTVVLWAQPLGSGGMTMVMPCPEELRDRT